MRKLWMIFFQILLISLVFYNSSLQGKDNLTFAESEKKIFHLTFNEQTGDKVFDEINGLQGNIRGGSWTQGVMGNGIEFLSDTDRIGFADDPLWDFVSNDFTISLWVKINSLPTDNLVNLISHGDGPGITRKWLFELKSSTQGIASARKYIAFTLMFHAWDNTLTEMTTLNSQYRTVDYKDEWFFLALTKQDNQYLFYLNQFIVGETSWNYNIGLSSEELSIGYCEPWDANVNALDGAIDEISIYNYALTQSQIYGLVNIGVLEIDIQELGMYVAIVVISVVVLLMLIYYFKKKIFDRI